MDGLGDRVSLGDKGEEVFNVNDERFFQAFGYILMALTQNCCFCSVAKSVSECMTPWTAAIQASLSLTISQFAQIHVHGVSDVL